MVTLNISQRENGNIVIGWKSVTIDTVNRINLAVADTAKLPFGTNSVDIVTSDHSLEPNGARILEVLN